MTNLVIKKPSECSENELDSFENLIKKGGEVAVAGLRNRIRKAQWLIFLFEDDKILAGIAALKEPNIGYKKKVFKKAESHENPDEFIFEVGWIYVEKQFRERKYSRLLLEEALKAAGNKNVYATTRENNEAMKRTNLRYGLEQSGHPYASEEGNYNLILYTKHSQQNSAA
jgi:predicted GNAT family N-acyltransferase